MKRTYLFGLFILFALLFTACTVEATVPDTGDEGLPAQAILEAQRLLSDELAVPIEDIQIVEQEQTTWPNTCLGLPEQEEMCAEVTTPGWEVTFEYQGQQYIFRTDELGNNIRRAQ